VGGCFSGQGFELGGELIGKNHSHWLYYAKRFRLQLQPCGNTEQEVVLGCGRLTEREVRSLHLEMSKFHQTLNDAAEEVRVLRPWLTPNARQIDRMSLADYIRAQDVSETCKEALQAEFTANLGTCPEAASLLAIFLQVKAGGLRRFWRDSEKFRCRGGNALLSERFASALAGDLYLNMPVVAIWSNVDHSDIFFEDGTQIRADCVVLATPPSTWSNLQIRHPKFPSRTPQMGMSVKYLAGVEPASWKFKGRKGRVLSSKGSCQMGWKSAGPLPEEDEVVVVSFGGGPAACRGERTSNAEIEALFPGVQPRMNRILNHDWVGDRFVRGGYSCPAPGEVTELWPRLQRLHPLYLAGEALDPMHGYMEGALRSGVRAARRITRRFKK